MRAIILTNDDPCDIPIDYSTSRTECQKRNECSAYNYILANIGKIKLQDKNSAEILNYLSGQIEAQFVESRFTM